MPKEAKTKPLTPDLTIVSDVVENDTPTRTVDPERKKKYISVTKGEKWWVGKARDNPAYFIEYITGKKPAPHHRIWIANFFHPTRNRINMVASRESAKTTISVYTLAWMIGKAPLRTNAIISVSAEQAQDRLRMIKTTIADNARFNNVFPWIHVDDRMKNTNTQFSVFSDLEGLHYSGWRSLIERYGSPKDATLYVSGAGGKGVIGRRISGMLLLDDIVDESMLSEDMQNKVMQYLMQTLIPTVQESGRVVNIGTRWMINDIYERLIRNPSWHSIVIPAILRNSDNKEFSYWPEYWPLEKLERKRVEMQDDILFRIMYLCDPTATSASLFTQEQMQRDLPEVLPEWHSIYITSDLAISLRERADFNVVYAIGMDRERNVYILDGMRYRSELTDSVEKVSQFATDTLLKWGKMDGIIFENVAFQAAFGQLMNKSRPDLQVYPHAPRGDKGSRATVASHYARQGRLFINQHIPILPQMKAEFMNFPLHSYDDTLDALSLYFQFVGASIVEAKVHKINSSVFL